MSAARVDFQDLPELLRSFSLQGDSGGEGGDSELETRLRTALLDLGSAEWSYGLIAEAVAANLPPEDIQKAKWILGALLREALDAQAGALADCEAQPQLLDVPVVLAEDPWAAEEVQERAIDALELRDVVECCMRIAPWLAPEESEVWATQVGGLDERLRLLLPQMGALEPKRIQHRANLEAEAANAWWWWEPSQTQSILEEESDIRALDAAKAIGRWVAERRGDGGGLEPLRLIRQEARALLASAQGQWLVERYPHLFDVREAELGDDEVEEQLRGIVLPPKWKPGTYKVAPLALAAATADGYGVRCGEESVLDFEAFIAAAVAGVGVLAEGRRVLAGGVLDAPVAWWVLPEEGVARVSIAGGKHRIEKGDWEPYGIVWAGSPEDGDALALEVWRQGDDNLAAPSERHEILPRGEVCEGDSLTDALRHLRAGFVASAESALANAQMQAAPSRRAAMSGLKALVDRLKGESGP